MCVCVHACVKLAQIKKRRDSEKSLVYIDWVCGFIEAFFSSSVIRKTYVPSVQFFQKNKQRAFCVS